MSEQGKGALMQWLRHPNIGRAIYVRTRPRPFLEWVARFTGRWFGIPILILDSFENPPKKWM
jgi:hypothetical protein